MRLEIASFITPDIKFIINYLDTQADKALKLAFQEPQLAWQMHAISTNKWFCFNMIMTWSVKLFEDGNDI